MTLHLAPEEHEALRHVVRAVIERGSPQRVIATEAGERFSLRGAFA